MDIFNNAKSFFYLFKQINLEETINYIKNIEYNLITNNSNEIYLLCQIFIIIFMYRCIASDKKFLKLYDTNIKDILSKIEVENIKLKEFSNNFDKKIKIIKRNINNIKKDIQCYEESI